MDTPENPDRPAETPKAASVPAAPAEQGDAAPEEEAIPQIKIDDFFRIDLRVATILEAEPHPNADRLLKMQIALGDEKRQLVAGIAGHYTPEELVGSQIVVVANLKPAKLRGEVSQGMLLAASDGDDVVVIRPDREVVPGSKVS